MYIYIALEGKSVRVHSSNDYVFCVFLFFFFHLLCFFMVSCPVSVLMMCNVSCICAVHTRKERGRVSEGEKRH